jgi:hypothetical protein
MPLFIPLTPDARTGMMSLAASRVVEAAAFADNYVTRGCFRVRDNKMPL